MTGRKWPLRTGALGLTLAAVLVAGASSCVGDDPAATDEELATLLSDLSEDPPQARAFLLGAAREETEAAADDLGVPEEDRTTWLLTEARLDEDATADAGRLVLAATTKDAATSTEVTTIIDEALRADGIEPGLRSAVGQALASHADTVYDDLATVTARPEEWWDSVQRSLLIEIGSDSAGHDALVGALEQEVRARLDRLPTAQDPVREAEAVAIPFARMVGALTLGAADAAEGEHDRGEVFAEGHERVAALVAAWAEGHIPDAEARTALANRVADGVTKEFR